MNGLSVICWPIDVFDAVMLSLASAQHRPNVPPIMFRDPSRFSIQPSSTHLTFQHVHHDLLTALARRDVHFPLLSKPPISSAKRNSTVSPLLRLPAELRNRIISLVPGYWIEYLSAINDEDGYAGRANAGLLLACRQTHYEAEIYCTDTIRFGGWYP